MILQFTKKVKKKDQFAIWKNLYIFPSVYPVYPKYIYCNNHLLDYVGLYNIFTSFGNCHWMVADVCVVFRLENEFRDQHHLEQLRPAAPPHVDPFDDFLV